MVNPESSFCELILKCMQDIVSFAIFFFNKQVCSLSSSHRLYHIIAGRRTQMKCAFHAGFLRVPTWFPDENAYLQDT